MDSGARIVAASLLLALFAAAYLSFAPSQSVQVTYSGGEERVQTVTSYGIPRDNYGRSHTGLLLFPVAVAAVPLLLRHRAVRILALLALFAFCAVGIFSVGFPYLPSALAMLVSCFVPTPRFRPL